MGEAEHDHGIWLNEPCVEQVLFSVHYEFTISLPHFDEAATWSEPDEEPLEDTFDQFLKYSS